MYTDVNCLDIETFNENNGKIVPYCICYLINKKIYNNYFTNKDIIIESLNKIFDIINENLCIIYIHNINFDGYLILESLCKQNSMVFNLLIKNNSIYSIEIKKNNKIILMKCSYKLIPKSLDSIADTFDIGKKIPFPHLFSNKKNLFYLGKIPELIYFKSKNEYEIFKTINENYFDFKKYSITYCENDVLITSNFIKKIKKIVEKYDINLDEIFSAPSLSIKIFIKKFNKKKISFNLKESDKSLIKNSYFGGRCEVYGNKDNSENVYHYDFSGMYAQCMQEKFPFGKTYIIENPNNTEKPGFYYIQYYSNIEIPVLPHKSKINNKLMFTNGENEGIF